MDNDQHDDNSLRVTPQDLHELTLRLLQKEQGVRPTSYDLLHTAPMNEWAQRFAPPAAPPPAAAACPPGEPPAA